MKLETLRNIFLIIGILTLSSIFNNDSKTPEHTIILISSIISWGIVTILELYMLWKKKLKGKKIKII